jgi:hypothetical protein
VIQPKSAWSRQVFQQFGKRPQFPVLADAAERNGMSAFGTFRTSTANAAMSAVEAEADKGRVLRNLRVYMSRLE